MIAKRGLQDLIDDFVERSDDFKTAWDASSQSRSITAALTCLRTEAGLTQAALAEKSGWNKSYVSRLENGLGGVPDTATIARYAEACGFEAGIVFASLSKENIAHVHSTLALTQDFSVEIHEDNDGSYLPKGM